MTKITQAPPSTLSSKPLAPAAPKPAPAPLATPPVVAPTELRTYQILFVVAGSTSRFAIKRAVNDVTNVTKEPVKQPVPAKPPSTTQYNPADH